ncbi:MAG: ABC transporter permease [Candidatus Limnocylindrales bacterium]
MFSLGFVSTYGLPALLVLLILFFSFLLPDTFPTVLNAKSILSDKSTVALLALGAMLPMATNNWDLSVAYVLCLGHCLAIGLQVNSNIPWPVVCVLVVVMGGFVGLVNGLLVTRARIDSFIATLGTGTILLGIAAWYTGGAQLVGVLPDSFIAIAAADPLGIPAPVIYVIAIAAVLWILLEYTAIGRYFYVLGSSPRAAELVGISQRRYVTLAFIGSGAVAGIAAVVFASRLHVGQSNVGPEFLLPAFTGAMLGSTSVHPGRVNVPGTIIAVLVLAVAVAGLQQLGASYFVEPLFNGTMLVAAVGLAGFAARRAVTSRMLAERAARAQAGAASGTSGGSSIAGSSAEKPPDVTAAEGSAGPFPPASPEA